MELNASCLTVLPWRFSTVFLAELLHHHLADLLAAARPDVDHLVVALAGGDQTRGVLVSISFTSPRPLDELLLLRRDAHVVHAERDAGARGDGEARLHQLVGEDHRLAQPAAAEADVDQLRDLLLLQRLVEKVEVRPAGRISDSSARPTVVS
jgi:hypothetical protein